MPTVLIAVDGTELDRKLVRTATDLFTDRGKYVIVNVTDDAIEVGSVPLAHGIAAAVSQPSLTRFVDGLEALAEDARSVAEQAAAGLPGESTAVGEVGDPISVILRAAAEHDADLIVVGTHDRSWFSRLFEPSISHGILQLAKRPVLVVHDDRPTDSER